MLLNKEIEYIRNAFKEKNGYPSWIINDVISKVEEEFNNHNSIIVENNFNVQPITEHLLVLPYKGAPGFKQIKKIRNCLSSLLPANQNTKIVFTATRLSESFKIKDDIPKEHRCDIVYKVTCPEVHCNEVYIGETGRRLKERINDHAGRDSKSHVLKHSLQCNHPSVNIDDFEIISSNYRKNIFKRRLSEALYIKSLRPSLNIQEQSYALKLYN